MNYPTGPLLCPPRCALARRVRPMARSRSVRGTDARYRWNATQSRLDPLIRFGLMMQTLEAISYM